MDVNELKDFTELCALIPLGPRDRQVVSEPWVNQPRDMSRIRACVNVTAARMEHAGLDNLEIEGGIEHLAQGSYMSRIDNNTLHYGSSLRVILEWLCHDLSMMYPDYDFQVSVASMDLRRFLHRERAPPEQTAKIRKGLAEMEVRGQPQIRDLITHVYD